MQKFIREERPKKEPRKWKGSLTEPDKTYTVNEIIERSRCGNMPDVVRNPQYSEDDYQIQTTAIDPLTQTEETVRRLQQKTENLKRKKIEADNAKKVEGTGGDNPPPATE